jgi:hypothetical protein
MSTRSQIKTHFQTGDKPSAADFADLIDSLAHAGEDDLATQSFVTSTVNSAVSSLLGGAPGALNTLDELAAALADDANFATTVTNALAGKQATLVSGSNIRTVNGQSLLGSGDLDTSQLAQTWNSGATVFNGIRLDVTDSASNANSNLLNLLAGGTSRFRVAKNGSLTLDAAAAIGWTGGAVTLTGQPTRLAVLLSGSPLAFLDGTGWQLDGTRSYSTCAPGFPSNADVHWWRDAAGVWAQRNGTNAQTLRVYNTFTDAANYERAYVGWGGNTLMIGTEAAGTGFARSITLFTTSPSGIFLNSNGNAIQCAGTLTPNGPRDLGVQAAKWRDIFLNPSASITLTTNNTLTFEATSNTSLTIKYRGSDGVTRANVLTLS